MSTSLLYHGFGLRGYDYLGTEYRAGAIWFKIEPKPERLKCSACGSGNVIRRGITVRGFKALPIGGKAVYLVAPMQRVECRDCQVVRQIELGFAETRRTYTRAFERYANDLCQRMTIQDVARHLGVGWDVIKDIQKRYLKRRFEKPGLKELRQIAIDEICVGKAHRYLTIVLDLESGAVVFVGEGKGAEALDPFWPRLNRAGTCIEAVATDMSPAYISAVKNHLPEATLVFDHFHVIKLYNEKLSDLRREVHREATEQLHKEVLKGTRWLLLKNPENLDQKKTNENGSKKPYGSIAH
jgi:transposase